MSMSLVTSNRVPLYKISKRFTDGFLKGLTVPELTTVRFDIGFKCPKPSAGSPYEILACEQVGTKRLF